MAQNEFYEAFQGTFMIWVVDTDNPIGSATPQINIHRDLGFLLQNHAPAATEIFILKSDFAKRHIYPWLPDTGFGLHHLSESTPAGW
jgi:hypothetical protein